VRYRAMQIQKAISVVVGAKVEKGAAVRNILRLSVFVVLALALAPPAASAKRPKPPPPDTAADCTFVAEAIVPDYLVVATINVGVRCATTKQTISVHSEFTRDGASVYVLPYGTDITCTNTTQCLFGYDLFSLDTQPTPYPGDQLYCASGSGIVGGVTLGPGSACEADARL
jgi:hypothetical protein